MTSTPKEKMVVAPTLHVILGGEIPNFGVVIKDDDVYQDGQRLGTIMRITFSPDASQPEIHYLTAIEETLDEQEDADE